MTQTDRAVLKIKQEIPTKSEFKTLIKLIGLLNEKSDLHEMIKASTKFLREWTGCEAVGIRLREGFDYPYYETQGFSSEFVEKENNLCIKDINGQILKDESGNPILECMCGNILCGRFDPAMPFFTRNGSFWSNHTTELLASTTEAERQVNTRNHCNGVGYESVVLIPLRANDETLGLIQLNDKRINFFTSDVISIIEQFGISISMALSQRMANEALRKNERRYHDMLDCMLEGVQIVGFDWRYLYVNDAFVKHSNYSKDELLKHTVFELYPDFEKTEIYKIYQQCFNERIPIQVESKFMFPDNTVGWYDFVFQPMQEGIFILSIDITERKKNELKLAEQNKKLQSLNDELEQFAYIASHDLQEPLRTLISFTDLLQLEYADKLEGEGKQYIDFISKSSERMKMLVKGLLDYSRIGKGEDYTTVDCNEMVNEILLLDLSAAVTKSNAKVTVHDLPVLYGSRVELRQLFLNLLSNAIKFRKKEVAPEISISASEKNKKWQFAVKDNGIGIAERDADKAFLIFKRMHNRNDYEGTGIGLYICKKIIELHGGDIWVDSKINEGSTFYFTIKSK